MEMKNAILSAAFMTSVVFGVLGIIYVLLIGASFAVRGLERLHNQSKSAEEKQ